MRSELTEVTFSPVSRLFVVVASHHALPSYPPLSRFKDACSLLAGCLPGGDHAGFVGGVSLGGHSASSPRGDVVCTVWV